MYHKATSAVRSCWICGLAVVVLSATVLGAQEDDPRAPRYRLPEGEESAIHYAGRTIAESGRDGRSARGEARFRIAVWQEDGSGKIRVLSWQMGVWEDGQESPPGGQEAVGKLITFAIDEAGGVAQRPGLDDDPNPAMRGVLAVLDQDVLPVIFVEIPLEIELEAGRKWGEPPGPGRFSTHPELTAWEVRHEAQAVGPRHLFVLEAGVLMVSGGRVDSGRGRQIVSRRQTAEYDAGAGRVRAGNQTTRLSTRIDPGTGDAGEYYYYDVVIYEVSDAS